MSGSPVFFWHKLSGLFGVTKNDMSQYEEAYIRIQRFGMLIANKDRFVNILETEDQTRYDELSRITGLAWHPTQNGIGTEKLYIEFIEVFLTSYFEEAKRNILQAQYKIMQSRLWYGITWPSMVLTLTTGGLLVWEMPYFLSQTYFIVKLCFVFGLILYHLKCHLIFKQLQNDVVTYSSIKLRVWNEVATLFLVSIVFLIVLKSNTGFIKGVLGLIIFTILLMVAIKVYKKNREKNNK